MQVVTPLQARVASLRTTHNRQLALFELLAIHDARLVLMEQLSAATLCRLARASRDW